ncbi:MAG: CZB domain-containing protein [Campylobacterales bacterium]|nr:CZB domain-containing protein [Campylobacterales bacterium]
MNKAEVLEHLRAAKAAHINWVQRAKLLVQGFEVSEDAIPVNSTQCRFGQWFYSDGQKLNACRNNPQEAMAEIEQLHFKLHDIYLNIFKIYYETEKKGFFSKLLFGTKKKVTEQEKNAAKMFFEEMEKVSQKLVEELNRMERRIVAVTDEDLAALV